MPVSNSVICLIVLVVMAPLLSVVLPAAFIVSTGRRHRRTGVAAGTLAGVAGGVLGYVILYQELYLHLWPVTYEYSGLALYQRVPRYHAPGQPYVGWALFLLSGVVAAGAVARLAAGPLDELPADGSLVWRVSGVERATGVGVTRDFRAEECERAVAMARESGIEVKTVRKLTPANQP